MGAGEQAHRVRNTEARDFDDIADLCRRVYPETSPWNGEQLGSHLRVFPEGQYVAASAGQEQIVGMTATLIIDQDRYDLFDSWDDFTAHGMLTNHDPVRGRTLYGVEMIVDPAVQGHGVGHGLLAAHKAVARARGLRRIRGGARLRDYHHHAGRMSAADYVRAVVHGRITDHTLTFHLNEGYHVIAVVPHYLSDDSETLGYAAVVEWLNPDVIRPEHYAERPTTYLHPDVVGAVAARP